MTIHKDIGRKEINHIEQLDETHLVLTDSPTFWAIIGDLKSNNI